MIRLAGLSVKSEDNPDGEIAITIIGRRPAEKTHEELFYDPESAQPTRLKKMLRAPQEQRLHRELESELSSLAAAFDDEDEAGVRKILFDLIKDGDHLPDKTESVVSLELVTKTSKKSN